LKFEYTVLRKQDDMYGVRYYLNEENHLPKYNDISLLRVLNILGELGWELVVKESRSTYILKRQLK
jgi:hypothetical protein